MAARAAQKQRTAEFDVSKLTPYQVPKEESVTLPQSRILDYDVRIFNNIPHFFAIYGTPICPVEEKLGTGVKPYYTKPTHEQVKFAQCLRKNPSAKLKSSYRKGMKISYDKLMERYNELIRDPKMDVEEAYERALIELAGYEKEFATRRQISEVKKRKQKE